MGEVIRWNIEADEQDGPCSLWHVDSPDGEFVKYEDYTALQQKLDVAIKRGDACMQAEMAWEKAMMAAIGEDGVGCVVKAIAALQQKLDALAAENAALKDINAWCHTEAFQNMYREFKTAEAIGCPDVDCMHDAMLAAIMHAPKTPATDAYLNSVRAEGVESLRDSIADIESGIEDTIDLHHYCADFAAQLRAGKDGE